MLETFVADQIVAFEKEHIDIPMTEIPNYIPRYDDIFKVNNKVHTSTQANISLSQYRKEKLHDKGHKAENEAGVGDVDQHLLGSRTNQCSRERTR